MQIHDIRDIVRIIENYGGKTRSVAVRRKSRQNGSNLARFNSLLFESGIQNESQLAEAIFGKSFSTTKYKTLKSSFVSLTINKIATLDIASSELSEYAKAIYKAHKYLFFVTFLLSAGSRSGAIHFAKRLLKLAEKYELHPVAVILLDDLRRYYLQLGQERNYEKYLALSLKKTELMANESRIRALEEQIMIHFSKSLFVDEKFKATVRDSVTKATIVLKNRESYFSKLSFYRLLYISHQINGDPLLSVTACDDAIEYMRTMPHMSPPSRFAEFTLYKLENYILIRDYEKGKFAAAECEAYINRGMRLWFSFKEYEFLLMMQTIKFDEALKIYNEVITHHRYSTLSKLVKEKWQLFGLNIRYAVSAVANNGYQLRKRGKGNSNEFRSISSNFPSYRKDKKGFNIAILIINILILLEKNDLDLLVEQSEALSSYRFQYLNESRCHQSFILFKLIRIMVRNDFDLTRIEKKSIAIEPLLDSAGLNSGEIFESIQILPPAWVWNRMKTILSKRKRII